MATSSFDVSFHVTSEAGVEAFVDAVEEEFSDPRPAERLRVSQYKGDPDELIERVLKRYAQNQ